MKLVECEKCGVCLACKDADSLQINTMHVSGTATLRQTMYGLEMVLRCRHCKMVTVTALFQNAPPTRG